MSFIPEEDYECNHTLNPSFSVFRRPLTCELKSSTAWWSSHVWRKKTKKQHLKWGLAQIFSRDLTRCWLFQSRERKREREREGKEKNKKKKTLDNHQCLQYLSSKRLKAHIAYNWIWFALPASVREIKGKHKNPHDSFSSTWQARPNRSWKEYLWRKPSRLLAQRLLEMTVLGNNEHIIKKKKRRLLWVS